MKLNELFTQMYKWNWFQEDEYYTYARFETEDKVRYKVTFEIDVTDRVEVEFRSLRDGAFGSTSIEGTGNAAKVLSTVVAIIEQYIQNNQPSLLYFSAIEPSRQKVYSAMIKKIAQKYDNYIWNQSLGLQDEPKLYYIQRKDVI